jgi:hypothetical protein
MKTVQQLTETLTWSFDGDTLTISGTGAMPDFEKGTDVPWYNNRNKIPRVNIKNGVTTIGERAFFDCSSLTSITIPNSVTNIGNVAFFDCSSLTSITIPNSATNIGEGAFCSCRSLTSITIPNSVTTIGFGAFSYCINLRNVVVLSTTPPFIIASGSSLSSLSTFYLFPLILATLTVPKGSKAAYQSAEGWNEFGTIIELEQ